MHATSTTGTRDGRNRSRHQKLAAASFHPLLQQVALARRAESKNAAVVQTLVVVGINVWPLQIIQIHAEVLLHHSIHSHRGFRELGQLPRGVVFLDDGGRCELRLVTGAPQPGMMQYFFGAYALAGVLHQEGGDEVFGLLRDVTPLGIGEVVLTLLDALEEQFLTRHTVVTPLPPTVSATFAIKWWVST